MMIVSFLFLISTGTISFLKKPAVIAASALCCDVAAYLSCSSLVIEYSFAIFSALKI